MYTISKDAEEFFFLQILFFHKTVNYAFLLSYVEQNNCDPVQFYLKVI